MVRTADVDHPVLIHKLAANMHELGQTLEALEMVDRQLAKTRDNGLMLACPSALEGKNSTVRK